VYFTTVIEERRIVRPVPPLIAGGSNNVASGTASSVVALRIRFRDRLVC
jgi:hypothetical protein